jgi:hypothetical protein
MKKHHFLLLSAILSFSAALCGQAAYKPSVEENAQVELVRDLQAHRIDQLTFLNRVFQTPILFFGKVTDELGDPVGGATVTYTPSEGIRALDGKSQKYTLITGKDGLFTIKAKGSDMYVFVEKEGYRRVSVPRALQSIDPVKPGEKVGSSIKVRYFDMTGRPERNHHPLEAHPVQFVIRKIGKLAELKEVKSSYSLKSNGAACGISLDDTGAHEIAVRCNSDHARAAKSQGRTKPYSWSFVIEVGLGGVLEVANDGFEAPVSGYLPSATIVSVSADSPRWDDAFRGKSFYVRFNDGVSAKVTFAGGTSHDNVSDSPYIYFHGLLNPDSKSRSLETPPIGR